LQKKKIDLGVLHREINSPHPNHVMGRPSNYTNLVKPVLDIPEDQFTIPKGDLISHDIIAQIIKLWQWEEQQLSARNKRRGREYFVYISGMNNKHSHQYNWPCPEDIMNASTLNVLAHYSGQKSVGHFSYIKCSLMNTQIPIMEYYDSSMYDGKHRSTKSIKDGKGINVMKDLEIYLNKICNGRNGNAFKSKKIAVTDIPRQTNDCDCGVFAVFFMDCARRRIKIKCNMTDEEVQLYRDTMSSYRRQGAHLINQSKKDVVEID
jgi:hypothetical protein